MYLSEVAVARAVFRGWVVSEVCVRCVWRGRLRHAAIGAVPGLTEETGADNAPPLEPRAGESLSTGRSEPGCDDTPG